MGQHDAYDYWWVLVLHNTKKEYLGVKVVQASDVYEAVAKASYETGYNVDSKTLVSQCWWCGTQKPEIAYMGGTK